MNSDNLYDEKVRLQLRLFEIGKDNLHGKEGLPGLKKQKNNISQEKQNGGSKKLLRPANKPFKVVLPPNLKNNQMKIQNQDEVEQNQMKNQNRYFADIDEVQQLQDEQILPKDFTINNRNDQNILQYELDKQRLSQIRPDSFRGLNKITQNLQIPESQQNSFTPRILTLNEISQKSNQFIDAKLPVYSLEQKNINIRTRNGSISKSALQIQGAQNPGAESSTSILQRHITDIKNPQFQQHMNIAPYLKQTRDFVIQKQQHERKLQSALSSHQNQHGFSKDLNGQKSLKNIILQSIDKNQIESIKSKPSIGQSAILNQVITSNNTGIQTMIPLGPSINSTRSVSKSRFEKSIQCKEGQVVLSRQSIQNIKSNLDGYSEENPILTQQRQTFQGLNSHRNLIPSISAHHIGKNGLATSRRDYNGPESARDPRVQKIQEKLKQDEQNAKQYFDYVNQFQKSSSRQNIVPGKTEKQEEVIRQQILIGKLRIQTDIHKNVLREQNQKVNESIMSIQSQNFISKTARNQLKSSFSSRNIPQILSDQQSQQSSIVNKTQRDQQSILMSDTFNNNDKNIISKGQADDIMKQISCQYQDYKPNDHLNIEDVEIIRQNASQYQFQNNKNSIQFQYPILEPEPEELNIRSKSQINILPSSSQIDSQEFLEKLIYNIQSRVANNPGFYIYLRQNEQNKQNPYDLVPFNPVDKIEYKRNENTFKLLINQRQQASSSQLRNHDKTKILKIGQKSFKSQYHNNDNQELIKNVTSSNLKQLIQKDSLHANQTIQKNEKYFTLSKQGITSFVNDSPIDFLKIEDWLAERAQFKQIKEKKFFKKFRLWKIIRMWRRNIIAERRNEVSANLKSKLFKVDEIFGKILLNHRIRCKDLENYRIIDMNQQNRDPYTQQGFQEKQHDVREAVKLQILKASEQTAQMFKSGIQETLDILKESVYKQEEFDQREDMIVKLDQNNQSRGSQNNIGDLNLMKMIQKIENTSQQSSADPVYEQLGFKHNLKYGARSQLRDACKKFLRFAFLLDFISLESLTNITLLSIQDFIQKIHLQVTQPIAYELEIEEDQTNDKKHDKKKKKDDQAYQNDYSLRQFPLFHADCQYRESKLPDDMKIVEYVNQYEPPPLGNSTKHDFNPIVHLELEPEKNEDSDQNTIYQASVEQSQDPLLNKYEFQRYQNLYLKWLTITPDKQDLVHLLLEQFQLGQECLRNFEKWACNAELKPYDNVLEPWDYRSYEKWEPPIELNEMYLNCDDWLQEQPDYIHLEQNVEILITKAIKNIDQQLKQIEPLLQNYWMNKQLGDFKILKNEKLKNPVDFITLLLERFVDQKKMFNQAIPQQKDLGLLKLNFEQLKDALTPQPANCIKKLKNVLPKMVKRRIENSKNWMEDQIKKLKIQPQNVDEFIAQIQSLEYIQDNFQQVKDQIDLNNQISKICERFDLFGRDDKQNRLIDDAYYLITILNNAIYDTKDKVDNRKDMIKKKIFKKIPKLNAKVDQICKEIFDDKYLIFDKSKMEENLQSISNIDKQFQELVIKKKNIQLYQKTMDIGVIEPFNNIEETKIALQARVKLWTSINSWSKNIEVWRTQPFDQIDVEYILEQASLQSKIVLQCERILPQPCGSVKYLKDLVFEFKETMPIIEALGNKLLEQFHWDEIKEKLGMVDFPLEEKQFSLGELVNYGVAKYSEDVVNISVTATQEFNILSQINALKETWKTVDFDLQPYRDKDAFILVDVDKIQVVLDESMQISSSIISSRYVKRLIDQALDMHEKLNLISETLEQWREAQKNWLYLQSIFQSQDIRKQRQKDFQDFEMINKQWIKLMKQTNVKRNVRFQCTQSKQRLNDFLRWNSIMEKIQKNLEEYLEDKRAEFPRFYFISNDELLRVLASSADLQIIEKLISKCFENLNMFLLKEEIIKEQELLQEKMKEERLLLMQQQSLKNQEDPKSPMTSLPSNFEINVQQEQYDHYDPNDIFGIKSTEKENLKFVKVLKIRGQGIEVWMKILDEYIQTAVSKQIKDAYKQFYDESEQNNRNQWVLKNLSQSVAVVSQITWTEGTEMAFNEIQDENPFAIEDFFDIIKIQLNQLTQLIIGDLTLIQRKILVALITQDVHARDIIEEIKLKNVQSVNDFIWQKQLRYYIEEDQVLIKQANTVLNYGYEYLGPTSRLVITPLTDKCWLTITGALNIKLGAQPQGPAGTGKTESTKDLAKAIGIYCVVVNCSDQIEYQTMAKHFSGVIQSGSWTCLDEFNRINIEVLSVIAQQLLDIKIAKSKGKDKFLFNEKERELKPQCGIFITMNPGYAGRQELPDNLKVLFRPVSMMIPNYGLIAEIMLFAEGFQEARALSKKMVQLYKLASEQLSQQDHYDFGLRAVKSVLVMAGNLKRQNPDLDESTVLIRAMRDSNVPKFLSSDLPLFQAIIQDLFPGILIPQSKHQELEQEINSSFEKMKLRKSDTMNQKVIQLFETLLVRFGVMIVGPAGGGKTTIYKLLAESLSILNQQHLSEQTYNSIKFKILNPKSISMGELYGEENLDTKEWTDGLASKILRKFAQPPQQDQEIKQKWCIFDGPVDAIWIENMNTVLDDNMTLCLVSGERIKLNNSIRILFEVQDLAQASPATVSRCGMVYVTPSDIGWKPYYQSWKQNYLSQFLDEEKLEFVNNLFIQYVDLAFQKLEKYKQKEVIQTIPLQNVQCLCNFIEHFIKNKKIQEDDRKETWMRQLNSIFGFSMIWSFGVAYDQPTLRYLDTIFKEFFPKIFIPPKDTVYQYFWSDKELRFKHWNEIMDEFSSRIEYPYDSLFVPTVDSISYTKILHYLMGVKKKVFLTGATGVGKSILIQEYISINQDHYSPIQISFSAQTSSVSVQKSIESKLVKKRGKKIIGINGNQQCIIFIDDINMPKVEQYGAQPPIEFLRLLIDTDVIYDRPTFFKKKIDSYQLICAAAPPGGGRAQISQRFMRHFHLINLPTASEEILSEIFDKIIKTFLDSNMFSDDVVKCGNIAVAATIDMFTQFNKKMLPIPSRFHYQFNLRDVSRVVQGILMSRTDSIPNSKVFSRLWVHECQRVFHDRLVDDFDRQYFKELSIELLNVKFKEKLKIEDLFYSNMEEDKIQNTFSMILKCDSDQKLYEQIQSPKKLIALLQNKIIDYNFTFSQQQMNLIFFEDAIDHICRITRVLNQPKGNSMLIGVSGCGKQSLTKLSAFLLEAPCRTIKIQKNYKYQNFRDDIKDMMLSTGCLRKSSVFLLADTQIIYEQFLEDVNCILNTGEISELYKKEDFDKMSQSLENFMKEKKIPTNSENIYQTFIQQIRLNFHVILSMSPVGDLLRIRCRNFPSLVNCCTIDWFNNWPEQALQTVAEQYFQANDMIKDNLQIRKSVALMFPKIHHGVEKLTHKFYLEQKRHVYITPKSFLDALSLFREQLNQKNLQVNDKHTRLTNGVEKLDLTNIQIKELQITLTELVPKLLQEQQSANEQAEIIQEQTQIAREREYEAELEVRRVQHETKQVQKLRDEAENLLNKAKPALLASEKAINELSKDDINELKKVNNPVPAVLLALECTLIYLGFTKLDWSTAQKALADMKFLDKLKSYDRNSVPENIFNKVNNIISKNAFDIEKMTKASKAAGGLAKWCKAIRDYSESLTIVRPRQAKLQEMTQKLQIIQEKCAQQEQEVALIKKNLESLQNLYRNTIQQIENFKNEKLKCENRLENASKLLNLLSSEGERWRYEISAASVQKSKLAGDVLLSSAQMSYLGPFTGHYRQEILKEWIHIFQKLQIDFSEDFTLVKTIGDPIDIRKWKINGLPNDSVSIDNAIFTMKSQSWPILIDPQQQANQWLKKMYKNLNSKGHKNKFNVTKIQFQQDQEKSQNSQFQQIMELSIKNGSILLIEDMSQEIDPSIEQIASKAIFKEQGIYKIKIGEKSIEYDFDFRLFFTTKIANPHFLPEVSIKLTVINFTVTFDGLDEQILSETVKNLEPEVERLRDQLIIQISQIQNEQQMTQQLILSSLAESNKDTILDNYQLIETLAISKEKSKEISESLIKSEAIEATVQVKREQYRDVSNRGSILFFVIASLSSVDPMYQNSLAYFMKIFNSTIKGVIKSQNLQKTQENLEYSSISILGSVQSFKEQELQKSEEKIQEEIGISQQSIIDQNLKETDSQRQNFEILSIKSLSLEQMQIVKQELVQQITLNSYTDICRGLFEAHKIIFSFVISISIQKNQGIVDEMSYGILLRGQGIYDKSNQPDYFKFKFIHEFFSEQQWDLAYCMQLQLQHYFANLLQDILDNYFEYKDLFFKDDKDFENAFDCVPQRFKSQLPLFQQLIMIKLLKPQLLVSAIKQYVVESLGKQYSISPITYIEEVFASSDKTTPIIFVLSPGADPNEQILQYAKKVNFDEKLFQKSLGQGQEKVATQLVNLGQKYGHWVLLQNCHLFKSWMPQLEALCDNLRENVQNIHPDFRLILTSEPKDYFPSAVLQNGIKITTEPPKGLKQNLKRITQTVIDEDLYNLQEKKKEISILINNNSVGSISKSNSSLILKKQEEPVEEVQIKNIDRRFDLLKCWKSMIFGLCFFHSVIQERKKFGSLGWNIMYEFNNSDLETSIKMLQKFITESEDIPWDAIQFMTGHINYGGRVTDDNDRLLLMSILEKCYGEQILDSSFIKQIKGQKKKPVPVLKKETTDFSFFDSQIYKIPKDNETLQDVYQYIDQLPDFEEPQICGMHPNASILNQIHESNNILKTILNIQMQPVVSQNSQMAKLNETINSCNTEEEKKQSIQSKVTHQDQQVLDIANELFLSCPSIINLEERSKDILKPNSKGLLSCYSIVLLQEQERYNRLVQVVRHSLELLIKAIQGQVLMSADLDEMYSSFLKNQVPQNWQRISYSSLKPLASWYKNLHQRIEFMRKWMIKGHPTAFWLQGFFFPHGFMTGILQTYARKHQKAIDFLKFKYLFLDLNHIKEYITKDKSDFLNIDQMDRIQQQPEDGVYIYGLYIESARWNNSQKCLAEQENRATISVMPIVHFLPFEIKHEIFKPKSIQEIEQQKKEQDSSKLKKTPSMISPSKVDRQNLEVPQYQGEEDEDLNNSNRYLCPLYKTSSRAGALSTTGQSTNYILSISLPINKKENYSDHWILRGTALLTMRDD